MIVRTNPFTDVYSQINCGDLFNKSKEMPILIDIEITNACNFNCLFCFTGTKSHKRPLGFMSPSLFEKIIDEIAPYKIPLRFIRWGEPTLHKNFIDFIRMAKERGIMCHFNTNGSMLNRDMVAELLDMKVDSMKYSFQGTDAKTYGEMRYGEDYNKLVRTVKMVSDMRGDLPYPFIHASTTITYETPEMVQAFKDELSPYCDLVTVGHTRLAHIIPENTHLPEDAKQKLLELKGKETISHDYKRCNEVYEKMSINWDGSVSACCSDYDNYMVVGNLNESSIHEVWADNPKLETYRQMLADFQHESLPLCRTCFDTMNVKQQR